MNDDGTNYNPVITLVEKTKIRLIPERKFQDTNDDFLSPSICRKELLARRIFSNLTVLQQLTHVDDEVSRAMMLNVPQLKTREQRDNLARILNKTIKLENG